MRKEMSKKIAAVAMSLVAIVGVGFGGVNTYASNATRGSSISYHAIKEIKITMKKGKTKYVGLSHAGRYPSTKNWKSSNSKVATVSSKGDAEGGHKITAKKKGKATISCVISKTSGNWRKGDVCQWVVTVK